MTCRTPDSLLVLVVEDDDDARAMLAELLTLSGYTVLEACGYRDALNCATASSPALALVDITLPDGDGLSLIRALRETNPNLVSLVSTGNSDLQTVVDAIQQGVYAYLLKPYDPQALLDQLRHAAEKWTLERQNQRLLQQARAEADRVKALLQASEEINAAYMDVAAMSRRVVETAVRIMASSAGFIALLEDDQLRVREWWDGSQWHPLEWNYTEGEGGAGHVWKTRATYRSSNAPGDPLLNHSAMANVRDCTMICAPILTRYGEFLGVLDLSDKNGGEPFTHDDARFVEGLCRHIAVALENARLYEERRRSEEQRKQFYRDVICAATRNKLILRDRWEVETPPNPPDFRMTVARPEEIHEARAGLAQLVMKQNLTDERLDGLLLTMGEAATNAYKHGGGGDISIWLNDDCLMIRVEDHGPGIDATTLPKATLMPGFSTKPSLGMGLTIILEFVDCIYLVTGPTGTLLDIQISLHPEEADPLDALAIYQDF